MAGLPRPVITDVVDARQHRFLHAVLDHRLVDDRQHLLRLAFVAGRNRVPSPAAGDDCFAGNGGCAHQPGTVPLLPPRPCSPAPRRRFRLAARMDRHRPAPDRPGGLLPVVTAGTTQTGNAILQPIDHDRGLLEHTHDDDPDHREADHDPREQHDEHTAAVATPSPLNRPARGRRRVRGSRPYRARRRPNTQWMA